MYIKRRVYYSSIDESGEEKLFSTTEFIPEEEYFSVAGEAVKASRAAKKAAKDAWVAKQAAGPVFPKGNLKWGRRANSPLSMRNGTWVEDAGANALQTKISTSSNDFLRRQAGGQVKKVNGKFPISYGKNTYGGGYNG